MQRTLMLTPELTPIRLPWWGSAFVDAVLTVLAAILLGASGTMQFLDPDESRSDGIRTPADRYERPTVS